MQLSKVELSTFYWTRRLNRKPLGEYKTSTKLNRKPLQIWIESLYKYQQKAFTNLNRKPQGEVGGWGRDPKKCTGRDWGMGSSTIQWNLRPVVKYHLRRGVGFMKFLENGSRPQPPTSRLKLQGFPRKRATNNRALCAKWPKKKRDYVKLYSNYVTSLEAWRFDMCSLFF